MVNLVGLLPRPASRAIGAGIGWIAFVAMGRLRRVGMTNLALAFPERPIADRRRILRTMYRNLGWQLGEFCKMPHFVYRIDFTDVARPATPSPRFL